MAEEQEPTGAGSEEEQQAEAPEEGGAEEEPSNSEESEETQGQEEEKDNLSDEPDTRSNAFFAGYRKGKKAEKAKQQDQTEGGQPEGGQPEGGEPEESGEQDVKQEVEAIKQYTQQQMVDKEVDEFVRNNPEFSEFSDKVRKWATHESRQNVPVDSIFYEVAGKSGKLEKIIAERTRQTDAQKSKTQGSGGSSARGQPSGKGVWDMSDKEFEQKKNEVKKRA